jgi:hypothetical protein
MAVRVRGSSYGCPEEWRRGLGGRQFDTRGWHARLTRAGVVAEANTPARLQSPPGVGSGMPDTSRDVVEQPAARIKRRAVLYSGMRPSWAIMASTFG